MQLQREREQWVKEQSKLITVIKLQQHELHAHATVHIFISKLADIHKNRRGIKVEDKASKIAQAFVILSERYWNVAHPKVDLY